MYRVWLADAEKAIAAVREKTGSELFGSISGNADGDFVFKIDEGITYIVRYDDFSVWKNWGDWRNPDWREIK